MVIQVNEMKFMRCSKRGLDLRKCQTLFRIVKFLSNPLSCQSRWLREVETSHQNVNARYSALKLTGAIVDTCLEELHHWVDAPD